MIENKMINEDVDLENEILLKLRESNMNCSPQLRRLWNTSHLGKCNFYAFDGDKLIGGLIGDIGYDWVFVRLLFVEPEFRGSNVGSSLMKAMEEYAIKKNLYGVNLETWDFQARGFYEKLGYSVYGILENHPVGVTEYHLKKVLREKVM